MNDYLDTNKIIYEFMGGELVIDEEVEAPHGSHTMIRMQRWSLASGVPIGKEMNAEYGLFAYHNSYDWLMPVVVKCLEMQGDYRWSNTFDSALLSCDIEKLYNAVVKYITYINTLKELE